MTFLEINQQIDECFDLETGEILDEERLNALEGEFNEKCENLAMYQKSQVALAKAIKEEEQTLAKRRKAIENRAESIKTFLATLLDGKKFSTPKVSISYRKSEAVEITDFASVPETFHKKVDPTADKTAIKEAIKSGNKVPGAELVERQSILIK